MDIATQYGIDVDSNPGVLMDAVRAETVRTLLEKRIVDRATAAKALLSLRIPPQVSAIAFGYDSVTEFLQEFVKESRNPTETPGFEPWTYDEMMTAARLRYGPRDMTITMVAEELGRSVKSVQSFFRRTFSQGLTIESAIWDLLNDGNSVDEVVTVADLPKWRVEFVQHALWLARFCALHGYPAPVMRFV